MQIKIGDKFYSNKPKPVSTMGYGEERGGIIEVVDLGKKYVIVQTERGKLYKNAPTVRLLENMSELERV